MSASSLLTRLWSHARAALTRLRSSIGPLDVLGAKERRGLSAWLRALEVFVRKTVLIEAIALAPVLAETAPSRAERPAARQRPTQTPAWRPAHALRLWPKPSPVRIRLLGRPISVREIWREPRRAALVARLARARTRRKPPHIRLADRIEALQRVIDAPLRAVRRLARKLKLAPRIALTLSLTRNPRSSKLDASLVHVGAAAAAVDAWAFNSS